MRRNQMRERQSKIFNLLCSAKKLSVRQIGKLTAIPKSSAHRHKKVIEARNLYPESNFWETSKGQKYQHRLVIATILIFGVMCGVGAGKIRLFFKLIRIFTHVGISLMKSKIRLLTFKKCTRAVLPLKNLWKSSSALM